MNYKYPFLLLLLIFVETQSAWCQVDRGGVPRSFASRFVQKSLLQTVDIPSPDLQLIQKEDFEDARLEKPYRVGVDVPVNLSIENNGQWDVLPGGGRIWRAIIRCKDARGIGLSYSKLRLPKGSDLFVYSPDQSFVIGAITQNEIQGQSFTTRPLKGDELVIEYFEPAGVYEHAVIDISGIIYMYRGFENQAAKSVESVSSGSCEINVNCEEGKNWLKQKQGVVKILTQITDTTNGKIRVSHFFCSGVLLNNTAQDFGGLMLTAGHCLEGSTGTDALATDYSHWVFYFQYESVNCSPTITPSELTVVGTQKLATSATLPDIGSDFLLLKSLNDIPAKYNPFYCGWDAGNGNSSSGVCIHHPDGDVKKISTYSSPLISGSWGSTPNTHWAVKWVATKNGYGVTEGGSSGAPLFDDEGLVIGTLTGGPSSCQNPGGEDQFGKIPFSWISNGTLPSQQLKPWLDPGNTGIVKMPGSYNEKLTVADFSANRFVIPVGGTIDFNDLSSGKPNKWHWYFQNGKPSESTLQNPSGILFDRFGAMNVKLVVSNQFNSDSIVKEKFIDVRSVVSPNPSNGIVSILSDINNDNEINIEVYNSSGLKVQQFRYSGAVSGSYTIQLPEFGNLFIIKIIQGTQVHTHKVVVVH